MSVDVYIEAKDLRKNFGTFKAVDGISLSVKKGEVLGFLGPNGAGKTTTMKMLTGFLNPSSGSARICDQLITTGNPDARRSIGYLAEGAPLYGEMTVEAFLTFIAQAHRIPKDKINEAVSKASTAVQLETVQGQTIDTLSKGFKRRVGLAAAIIHEPDVLILDEPTDGLDPNQKHEVRSLIETMSAKRAIIISTHILEEVDALCSRVVVINKGQIVADDTPSGLRAKSRYHNAVTITVPKEISADVIATMNANTDIDKTEYTQEDKSVRITALNYKHKPIAATIDGLIKEEGWTVEQYAIEAGRLDDVFRSLTQGSVS
ncbi:ABC transporter ATP-binding protein [Kordiimonas sp. SCSIO 12610]|nr:ABC transporter ATP-binding protein [Kordiimonas sp. SCSIO 12610]